MQYLNTQQLSSYVSEKKKLGDSFLLLSADDLRRLAEYQFIGARAMMFVRKGTVEVVINGRTHRLTEDNYSDILDGMLFRFGEMSPDAEAYCVFTTKSFMLEALQGVIQLDKMGVPIMSVEIVAKLCLRELGPFVLALVIAGRSASSFSAQIGVMNLNEENDALKTMGFSVIDFLVTPRILALIITMPLLVFLSDVVSLLAGMLATNVQAGISFTQYWERFYEYVAITHFWVGIVKAPFFGLAIGLVGCFRGLKVQGDTESLGRQTTLSVVNAIFWIIVINAIFSFFTTTLGI